MRRHLPDIPLAEGRLAVDLGAGNLRNTEFAESLGWVVMPIDAAGDHGSLRMDLGRDRLPCHDMTVSLFLCNYVMCFMDAGRRAHLISEIRRTARLWAHLVVEMFPSKRGVPYDTKELFSLLGREWDVVRMSKDRFIARRIS